MAAAVLADIEIHGPGRVAALAVSHADCEALADRIRADLVDQGLITGPGMEGPGWSGPRRYQAGDRILLHAHASLGDGTRLTNGTVATVTAVTPTGLAVTTDTRPEAVVLPAGFVSAKGGDGRPQVSHSWARTMDGVQGATVDQVHLLATPTLDRYRGYVGQSRSIQPTHTWNTTPKSIDDPGDHGGRLVQPYSTTAEQIAAALARAQPKTFAAVDDPRRHEQRIRAEQAAHQEHLDRRPLEVVEEIRRAEQTVAARQEDLHDAQARLAHWRNQAEQTAGLRGFTPSRRERHHHAMGQVRFQAGVVERETERLDTARREHQQLLRRQAAGEAFDQANQWRRDRIDTLEDNLRLYWAQVVLDAARDGHPGAYGKQRLKDARQLIVDQIETLTERPVRGQPQPERGIDDPLRALVDLDRAISQATKRPDLRLVETIPKVGRQQPDAHWSHVQYQHILHEQMQPSEGMSIGIDL